jgi:membrane protein
LLFAIIYKMLPDTTIAWGDVAIGAVATSLLFAVGKFLIGLYLVYSSVVSAYGAAGSLVVVLVWVYYSAQIFYFGAEFTKVYATRMGHRVPSRKDVAVVDQESLVE